MHSHEIQHNETTYHLNVNGDFSGNVVVIVPHEDVVLYPFHVDSPDLPPYEVTIPFAVLEEFVGRRYQNELIHAAERESGTETLRRITR